MLSETTCNEIKEHLLQAQNPVFYYDNDADGLCSFLLFARFLGRGNGVAVRSYPSLHATYARKARELGADAVFILDKPLIDPGFVLALKELAIPVIWVDHHEAQGALPEGMLLSYNPLDEEPASSEPVTYWAQQLCGRKDDLWIALMGCIADHYLPDFAETFGKQHSELWSTGIRKPFDAYYRTGIGKIARALNFGLKDSATNVVRLQQYLLTCRGPGDVLAEVSGNAAFRSVYERLQVRYERLLSQALQCTEKGLMLFSYGGATSMSSELANELAYRFPGRYIVVAYTKDGITNLSLRGENVKTLLERVLPQLSGASGGGHRDAVGARIQSSELARFHELVLQEVSHGCA